MMATMNIDMCMTCCWGNMMITLIIGIMLGVMLMKLFDQNRKSAWVQEMKTYQKLEVDDLKYLLKMKGLSTTGIKEDLIKRLIKSTDVRGVSNGSIAHEHVAQITTLTGTMRVKMMHKKTTATSPQPNVDERWRDSSSR
jgi:hypothetical protein